MLPGSSVLSRFHSRRKGDMSIRRRHRTFDCKLCGKETHICSDCDRGNVYCSRSCFVTARREQCREAGRTYGQTDEGRAGNARRQRESYERRRSRLSEENREDLTHQTSEPPRCEEMIPTVVAAITPAPSIELAETGQEQELAAVRCCEVKPLRRCDFCGRPCCNSSPRDTEDSKHGPEETDSPAATPSSSPG